MHWVPILIHSGGPMPEILLQCACDSFIEVALRVPSMQPGYSLVNTLKHSDTNEK
jgi:hypothetical protein